MNWLFGTRPWLLRALTVATAASGPVVAIALLATLGAASGLTALLHIVAATIALGVGLLAVIHLQRTALVDRSRGRSVAMGASEPGVSSALRVALATTVLVLVVSAVIEFVALQAAARADGAGSLGTQALQDARARRAADTAAPFGSDGSSSNSRVVGPLAADDDGSGDAGGAVGDLLSGAEVLRIRPADEPSRDRLTGDPLHLRGFVLDTYDGNGRLRERRGQRARISADESRWIDLRTKGAPAVRGVEIDLEVAFVGDSNGLIFAPSVLTSVLASPASEGPTEVAARSSVEFEASQATLWLDEHESRRYRARSTMPAIGLDELRAAAARGSITGADGLPPESGYSRANAMTSIRSLAAALTDGFETDVDRVLAVVRHLREEFSYEIYDTRFLSPEEVLPFMDRSAGSCTHFASLATLLLRLEGIPTRLAAGYVAREVDFDTGEWIVRERDGHVWIEVHFEGFGWLPFDPTPGDPEVGGTQAAWTPLMDEARIDAELQRHAAARTSPLGRILGSALEAISRVLPGVSSPAALAVAAALGALGLVALVRRSRGHGRLRGGPRGGAGGGAAGAPASIARPGRPSSGVTNLLGALRGRGWTQGRTTTPSAFARGLETAHPEAQGVSQAIGLALRSACTGHDLAAEEERQLDDVSDRIRGGP